MSDRLLLILRRRLLGESGASAISLLAVVATLGIVAAIAIPALHQSSSSTSSSSQTAATGQAQDVQAKNLLVDAQTAMATYAASNGTGYTGATPAALSAIEPTILTSSTTQAYLASVDATQASYTLVAVDPLTGNSFTLANSGGATTRTCTTAGRGGCPPGGTW